MFKVELHKRLADEDPAPRFAGLSEIEIAEQLRHQLEERLLPPATWHSALTAPSSDVPEESARSGASHRHEYEQS